MKTYKSIIVSKRGGPENLKVVENDLRPPTPGEARIRVIATPVCQDDIGARVGNRPFLPKLPFVPGYAIIGDVDAVGDDVTQVSIGERVTALIKYGGYSEYLYWPAEELVQVPKTLDPAEAIVLILNYLVAYQTLHRVARVKAGDKVLIVGASGGVGTAYLQLGKLAGIKMYGLASTPKHDTLRKYGATPIDYRTQDFVKVLQQAEPNGIDFVFNGMSHELYRPGMTVLKQGGVLVHYGAPQSFSDFLLLIAKLLFYNILPNGKKVEGYGTHRLGVDLFREDWTKLFSLLADGRIQPLITHKYPLIEAAQANELLESGQVTGNLVLLAPEYFDSSFPDSITANSTLQVNLNMEY